MPGRVDYLLPGGRPKVVHYWSAEVDAGQAERHSYEANGEIRALEWVPLAKAAKHLTYAHDADVVERDPDTDDMFGSPEPAGMREAEAAGYLADSMSPRA